MRAADPTSKALVFTQYNSTLEFLKVALPAAGFGYRSISGSMPLQQRTRAIEVRSKRSVMHHAACVLMWCVSPCCDVVCLGVVWCGVQCRTGCSLR